jgi:oligosaccharide 4-alpha-D-glucosyltransferase
MLPYVYTLAWENTMTGMPLMRPLFFENEDDPSLIDEKDAYLWGDAFLVAPVTDPGVDSVNVDLPPGAWFDFWDGARYEGGRTASVGVTLETIPVLVRAGSFVPMIGEIQTTRDYTSEKLTVHYYADGSVDQSTGVMYDDDGVSRTSLADGRYELLNFAADHAGNTLAIGLERSGGSYEGMPSKRELTLVVHNWTSEIRSVRYGDTAVPLRRKLRRNGDSAVYDAERKRLSIRVTWDHAPVQLTVE